MTIQAGDRLPEVVLQRIADGVQTVDTRTLFDHKNAVIFAVPGAFTPTCSERHLPGYIQHMDEFRHRGIEVACVAVNDPFVMQAWAQSQHVPDDLMMLADGNGDFARALGFDTDLSKFNMGTRARRASLIAEDGVVKELNLEAPGKLEVSTADATLCQL
jgi:peroxiredoxin